MNRTIRGPFDVKLEPVSLDAEGTDFCGAMSLDKRFQGALDATSHGLMLGVRTSTPGSAGYVAMERIRGSLEGRAGTFVLQHSSTMSDGEQRQSITVVPDSGTDALAGLDGSMVIEIENGEHTYVFTYRLASED